MSTSLPRVLVADDQPDVLQALRLLLTDSGFEPDLVASADAVVEKLREQSYELLLIDLNYSRDTTSGREGLELLSRVRAFDAGLPVVVMTGWGSIDTAVDAMRRGARSFVQKPWDDATLLEILQREIEEARAARRRDEKQQREQHEARLIQRGLLPASFPATPSFRIAGAWQPASGFGGDCYDALTFGTDVLGMSIADVAGKGLPAALLMSNLQAAVRAFAQDQARPRAICASVNRLLCLNMTSGRFVTFCYLRLDGARRVVSYANAGHNPPLLARADGRIEKLSIGGMVLGVFQDTGYDEAELPLEAGDRILLYTDGITEARDASGDEFGDERLAALLLERRDLGADSLYKAVLDRVTSFASDGFQDDATIIVVEVL
ncbi:MAG: PP2C family protein-serine/threonine phosphatase [Vicinamibacterales bacterium]